MKLHIISLFCYITVSFLSISRSVAQPETIYSYWVSAGLGAVGMSDLQEAALGGSGRIAFSWSESVVSLSAGGGGTVEMFGTNDDVTILNVCYGRLAHLDAWLLRFAAGPAYMNRVRRTSSLFAGSSTQLDISEIGIAAEAEVILHSKLLGIGLAASGAMSENISALLITINVSIGSWHQ